MVKATNLKNIHDSHTLQLLKNKNIVILNTGSLCIPKAQIVQHGTILQAEHAHLDKNVHFELKCLPNE